MLEHYALEDDPLEAFKQRQSRLEQVGIQIPTPGWGHHSIFPLGCVTLSRYLLSHATSPVGLL